MREGQEWRARSAVGEQMGSPEPPKHGAGLKQGLQGPVALQPNATCSVPVKRVCSNDAPFL
eukprot:871048-Pelagomonas_calceolata.AAC.4